jgi:HEAT repeat protein
VSKASRKIRTPSAAAPSGVEGAFALWGRGNLKMARTRAKEQLAGELTEQEREQLLRLLQDTAPDPRARQIAVFALAVVVLVILLTKLLS